LQKLECRQYVEKGGFLTWDLWENCILGSLVGGCISRRILVDRDVRVLDVLDWRISPHSRLRSASSVWSKPASNRLCGLGPRWKT
jgi:hypothetical protein